MTHDEYKKHFKAMLAGARIDIPEPDRHITRAISQGLKEFWGAKNWIFRETERTLTMDSTADQYNLPADFDGFKTIREEGSTRGRDLTYRTKEDFSRMLPKLSSHTTGNPTTFTIFRDADNGKWKIRFYPRPTGGESVIISMILATPTDVTAVPDRFHCGLEPTIGKHVFPYGSLARQDAAAESEREIKKLEANNTMDMSSMTTFRTTTTDQVRSPDPHGVPWLP